MSAEIQIGMPCVYEGACFWIGTSFGVLIFAAIAYFVWSAWQEKRDQERQRDIRRQKRRAEKRKGS